MDKRDALLHRVFKMIAMNYFIDHKMGRDYCDDIKFNRGLGEDIANHIHSINPKYYQSKRREYTSN